MSRLSSAEISTPTVPSPTVTGGDQARARLDALVTELGDDVQGSEVVRNGDVIVRVAASAWRRAAEVCKAQGYDYFCFLSGIDWMPSTSPNPRASVSDELDTGDDEAPAERGEAEEEAAAVADNEDAVAEAEPEVDAGGLGYPTGVAGGDTRFQVFARLYSTTRHEGVTLKADLDPDAPSVETWSGIYPGSDWNERETWEMYGFVFEGHPNLIKLYLPGEFEGFPLRKDFPLLSREVKPWPGLVDVELMPEVPESEAEPAPEAPAPEAPAPEAPAPEAPAPEAHAPEAHAPEVPAPEAHAPEAHAPEPELAAEVPATEAAPAEAAPAEAEPAEAEPGSAAPAPLSAAPEPAAAAPEPAAAAPEPAAPPPAENSVPETAEEAHATGTESATTGPAAEAVAVEAAPPEAPGPKATTEEDAG